MEIKINKNEIINLKNQLIKCNKDLSTINGSDTIVALNNISDKLDQNNFEGLAADEFKKMLLENIELHKEVLKIMESLKSDFEYCVEDLGKFEMQVSNIVIK